ncbi:hypothetical protein MUK42_04322 [Musa troglodytarum]|uniref:Uncharacterized protein n=1 Tax=Musa troglodytarum TaxID=320322 RepID=A0A9E7KBV3_9LILI|nr:hypothetical protein MUK42_04322 [Musa troglodytarum]
MREPLPMPFHVCRHHQYRRFRPSIFFLLCSLLLSFRFNASGCGK